MQRTCSRLSAVGRLAEQLVGGLRLELDLTPKPGLVDRWNNGSHSDLNYPLMAHSIDMLGGYFSDFAAGLEAGLTTEPLRRVAMEAEARMLAQFGTNTHRGAIFLGGLLLAGVHRADELSENAVSRSMAAFALELFAGRLPTGTIGAGVRAQYGVGGIVCEALDGLPCVFQVGLPALREARQLDLERDHALYLLMARLMQTVEDTTTLRRCGPAGLAQLRRDGVRLEELVLAERDPIPFLITANDDYRRQRLTMGGVADLMGMCAAWSSFAGLWDAQPGHADGQ